MQPIPCNNSECKKLFIPTSIQSWYCPECRAERNTKQLKEADKRRYMKRRIMNES